MASLLWSLGAASLMTASAALLSSAAGGSTPVVVLSGIGSGAALVGWAVDRRGRVRSADERRRLEAEVASRESELGVVRARYEAVITEREYRYRRVLASMTMALSVAPLEPPLALPVGRAASKRRGRGPRHLEARPN